MKTALWNRLARVEERARPDDDGRYELWVGTGDDDMLSPTGEVISLAEFERRYPDAIDLGGPDASVPGGMTHALH
jgi:hypothetical protein